MINPLLVNRGAFGSEGQDPRPGDCEIITGHAHGCNAGDVLLVVIVAPVGDVIGLRARYEVEIVQDARGAAFVLEGTLNLAC